MERTVEQVRPVERPLLATARPTAAAAPEPACGGPSVGIPPLFVPPNSRIVPSRSTVPATTCASAASTFGGEPVSRLKYCESCDKTVVPTVEQFETPTPGWMKLSLDVASSLRARRWLLLRK